jgi:small neutral amino acid transporter SnatA (MarC family)
MQSLTQNFAEGLGQGLARIAVIAIYAAAVLFVVLFLIGFWLSGRFVRKIKSKILRALARIVLSVIFSLAVISVIILIKSRSLN